MPFLFSRILGFNSTKCSLHWETRIRLKQRFNIIFKMLCPTWEILQRRWWTILCAWYQSSFVQQLTRFQNGASIITFMEKCVWMPIIANAVVRVYRNFMLKDVVFLDGEWDLFHLDDMLASQNQSIDLTLHTTWESSISVMEAFWLVEPCMRKRHTRLALKWTAVSTIGRPHQQNQGNHTDEWTPVGLSPVTLL